jgi:hypothetical protein
MPDAVLDVPDPCDRCDCCVAAGPRAHCDRASQAQGRAISCRAARVKYAADGTCAHFVAGGGEFVNLVSRVLEGERLPAPPPAPRRRKVPQGMARLHSGKATPSGNPFAALQFTPFMLEHLGRGGAIEAMILTKDGPRLFRLTGPLQ